MEYRGYTIWTVMYQGCRNYKVVAPYGMQWTDLSPNLKTAKKWVDADILERAERRNKRERLLDWQDVAQGYMERASQ